MHKITTIVSESLLIIVMIMVCSCKSSPTTSTTTDFNSINSAVLKSADGLSLSLLLNSTTYQPGQEVAIVVEEINNSAENK